MDRDMMLKILDKIKKIRIALNTLNTRITEPIVTENKTLGEAAELTAGNIDIEFNVEKTGYTPIGVGTWSLNNRGSAQVIHISGITISSNKVHIFGKVTDSVTIPSDAYVSVLYQKT